MLAVGCIVLLASAGQTVTGFGFALLAAPLLAVVVGSHESVAAVTVISLPVTSLMAGVIDELSTSERRADC